MTLAFLLTRPITFLGLILTSMCFAAFEPPCQVETGNNGSAVDVPQLVANSMMNMPRSAPSLSNANQVLNFLQNFIEEQEDGGVVRRSRLLMLLAFCA